MTESAGDQLARVRPLPPPLLERTVAALGGEETRDGAEYGREYDEYP